MRTLLLFVMICLVGCGSNGDEQLSTLKAPVTVLAVTKPGDEKWGAISLIDSQGTVITISTRDWLGITLINQDYRKGDTVKR